MTPLKRRTLLRLLAGGLAWPMLPLRLQAAERAPLYLSAHADAEGNFRVAGFRPDGRPVFDLPLPARSHSFAVQPGGRLAAHFARRPGSFARILDLRQGTADIGIEAPEDRHFYGHGVFSPDGRLLYAAENDFVEGRGVIGIYDAANGWRRIGELPSHGIGPHEIRLLPDGVTMIAANGGIQTRPDLARVKLNLPTMSPSLVYLDRRDGRLLKEVRLPREMHQLGIRHVAVGADDTVALAMQYEGPEGDSLPLVATHRGNGPVRLLKGPADVVRSMNQYCGSTNFDPSGEVIGVSAPRGNLMTFWDRRSGTLLSTVPVPDGCGIAAGSAPGRFLASSGRGGMVEIDAHSGTARKIASPFLAEGRWDNHMVRVDI